MRAHTKEIPSLLLPTPPLPAAHLPRVPSGMFTVLSHLKTAVGITTTATVELSVKTMSLIATQAHTAQADPLTQFLASYGKEDLF